MFSMDAPINLYFDKPDNSLETEEICRFLSGLGFNVTNRGDFFKSVSVEFDKLSIDLAKILINNFTTEKGLNNNPSRDETHKELSKLNSPDPIELMDDLSNIYEGHSLVKFLKEFVGSGLHILFTSRMFATYEGRRYHGRTIIMDFPLAVISTTGIVEAPAKPKEYYIKLAAYNRAWEMGYGVESEAEFLKNLKAELGGQFIDYGDNRLTEIVKGYALQALYYLIWGELFCKNPVCALYNAHTQTDLIQAQLGGEKLCKTHSKVIKGLM